MQEPVEQSKPDPIVGTYRVFSLTKNYQRLLRFYPDGSAIINGAVRSSKFALRWKKENEIYRVYQGPSKKVRPFAFKLQSIVGEPDLAPALTGGYEGLRVSNNPNYLFDLYVVECLAKSGSERCGADTAMGMVPRPGWTCWNIGRRLGDRGYYRVTWVGVGNKGKSRDYADSRAECEALCEAAILNKFETIGEGNCSGYQGYLAALFRHRTHGPHSRIGGSSRLTHPRGQHGDNLPLNGDTVLRCGLFKTPGSL